MKFWVRYELQVEAENEKQLKYKLSLLDYQAKMKDKHFTREISDDAGWTSIDYLGKEKLNTMEF